jgi:hypothetical protein
MPGQAFETAPHLKALATMIIGEAQGVDRISTPSW